MLLAVVMGLLVVGSLVAFLVPLRIATRTEVRERPAGGTLGEGREFVGLDHLAIGVELQFDRQRWFVRGVQRVRPADGPEWAAWHLDDRGQGGLLVTGGPQDDVLFAVRAERPETLDPEAPSLRWRDHEWVLVARDGGPVDAAGERRGPRRGAFVPVSGADVERVVFARPEMPARRLVLERSVRDPTWNAWIGTVVPGRMVDVWPPAAGQCDDGAADATADGQDPPS